MYWRVKTPSLYFNDGDCACVQIFKQDTAYIASAALILVKVEIVNYFNIYYLANDNLKKKQKYKIKLNFWNAGNFKEEYAGYKGKFCNIEQSFAVEL